MTCCKLLAGIPYSCSCPSRSGQNGPINLQKHYFLPQQLVFRFNGLLCSTMSMDSVTVLFKLSQMDSRDADSDTEFGVYIVIIDADIQKRSWE